jgi:hypothetical protein
MGEPREAMGEEKRERAPGAAGPVGRAKNNGFTSPSVDWREKSGVGSIQLITTAAVCQALVFHTRMCIKQGRFS